MPQVVRFVNTASTAGGDGTTNATSGGNRAYASLNEWEAAEQTDLVTDGDTHLVHCEGSTADTTTCTINSWTTGASNDITVQVDSDVRHDGKWDTSAYRLSVTDAPSINLRDNHASFIGLQLQILAPTVNARVVFAAATQAVDNAITIAYCIIRGPDDDLKATNCLTSSDADAIVTVYNTLVYDAGNHGGSDGIIITGTVTAYNNTIANCATGIRGSGTWTEKNNLVSIDLTDGVECWFNDGSHTRGNSTGNDATANEQGGSGNRDSQTFTFVDEAADDYHLASGDTGAKDFGATDPGNGLFLDDIDGVTRSGSWDIGCDEFVAAGGPVQFDIILADIVFIKQLASDTVNIKQVSSDTVNIVQVDSDTVGL